MCSFFKVEKKIHLKMCKFFRSTQCLITTSSSYRNVILNNSFQFEISFRNSLTLYFTMVEDLIQIKADGSVIKFELSCPRLLCRLISITI